MVRESHVDRRDFLRQGLKYGGYAAGALIASATLEGCFEKSTPPSTTTTSSTTTTLGPVSAADWSALASSLSGSLVLPTSASYATDRLLYNSKFVGLHPRAIAYCATPDDVARCVAFCTSHALALAARSGGHSYGGYSSCDGLVIDVSRMKGIAVNTSANTASIGAGAQLIDVYNVLGSNERLLPGGSCPTVGIAGLTLGGGIGVFGRKYGLTTDSVRSVDIVMADGTTLTADAQNNADLLWACQGGGGGNFGVVTNFEFNVYPIPPVALFTLQFPWDAATTMLAAWQEWVGTLPDELWSNCLLLAEGTAGYLAQVSGVFCGAEAELNGLLAALTSSIATTPTAKFVGSNEYVSAMQIEAGCSGLSIVACHQSPEGVLGREAYTAKSSYVSAPMTSAQVALNVEAVVNLKSHAPSIGGGLAFDAYGGAINRIAQDATAFVHRDKLACIQASYSWSSDTDAAEIAAGQTWLTWLQSSVFDPQSGAYQNYIDPTLAEWQSAYYGSNLGRLAAIKKKYDADNVFSFAQSIPRGA
jgi:hypothetical protein